MKEGASRKAIHRSDYQAYPWTVEDLQLHFDIFDDHTRVRSRMSLARNGDTGGIVALHGRDLELRFIHMDGVPLDASHYRQDGEVLEIDCDADACELSIEVDIDPARNTALEGLYADGKFLLTQCEAEGFRKITYFPDRPDVMTRYTVTIEADKARYPVLLGNGNRVDGGEAENGRHWARWEDPFPKPSYLFALVAGDLAQVSDHFTTMSGREVELHIWVEHGSEDRCDHAMQSLINAMRWDEERFGLEYDLDIYNVVVTHSFNMGAMENKSLNIFNSKYVLARPDTATDTDYQYIEGVVGHEYFHNWTGNRVTCRDWFQLTLKEGLTVFRDEEFSSDMQSRAVKRIQDVRDLRSRQYPEDAGPMAHPIRPDHYIEINNFYTATVYEKGAAVIRMVHTLLGEEGFQAGMRLYFERHDGQAVTCDDFIQAMADASGVDLDKFRRWYQQSGTPSVQVSMQHDEASGRVTLTLRQQTLPTADQAEKQPLVIPFAVGWLGADGEALQLGIEGGEPKDTHLLLLQEAEQVFHFEGAPGRPIPSLLRDHSAPVRVHFAHSEEDLAVLAAHDSDAFVRWESAQELAARAILASVEDSDRPLSPELESAVRRMLEDDSADPALVAEALSLPGEELLADRMDVVRPVRLHEAREHIARSLGASLQGVFLRRFEALDDGRAYEPSAADIGRRSLKNVCLAYLSRTPAGAPLARAMFAATDNMTDRLAALKALVYNQADGYREALAAMEQQWRDDPLVMDKWLAVQAVAPGDDAVDRVSRLVEHPSFSIRNPNKVRSVIGAFAMMNPTGFHAGHGRGYRFVADNIIALNAINPQTAARMASAFNRWKRYDEGRQALMRAELERIAATPGLSPDVYEIVTSALR